jgi:tetratricopeptide (TPR) repeat protein
VTSRLAIALVALLARAAAADAPSAEQLYRDGQTAYDDKRYDDALAAWQKSYELSHLPALEFNIAQAYRLRDQPGDCARAASAYKKFVELAPDSPQRDDADGFLRELAACATTTAKPPAKPAPAPTKTPAPPRSRHWMRVTAVGIAGAGIVLAGVGAYYSHQAKTLGDQVNASCANGCDWLTVAGKDADGRAAARDQWILYSAAAASIATSALLWTLGAPRRATVAVAPRPDGAVLAWSIRW